MKEINWSDWWNAVEYSYATLHDGNVYIRGTRPEWMQVHSGRAHSSRSFLGELKKQIEELKKDDYVLVTREEYEKLTYNIN